MTTTVTATAITAPSADLLAFLTEFLADSMPNVATVPLGPVDGVTGEADEGNATGAADGSFWVLDAGQHNPGGGLTPLPCAIVDLAAIAPPGGSLLSYPATLAIGLGSATARGTHSGIIALVVDPSGEDFQVIDTASVVPTAADGAATVNLTGFGAAAVAGLATGDALLVVGFISDLDSGSESIYSIGSFTLSIPTAVGGAVSNNAHAQTANCMLIAVGLDGACEIVENAPVFVTAAVGKITPTVQREDGTDYTAKNFGGVTCGPEQTGDSQEKGVDLEGEFCLVNWAFMSMTSGNPKIVDGDGNVIGYQQLKRTTNPCDEDRKPHVALTVIRKATTDDGGCVGAVESGTGVTGSVAHTYPNTYDWTWDIPEHADARAMVPFKCKGATSPNPGRGPLNLYPAGATPARIDGDAFYVPYFVTTADLPTISENSTSAHPAPLGKV